VSGAEDLSYEQLAAVRTAACCLRDMGVLFLTERDRMGDVIKRIDAAVQLKRERDAARAERRSRQHTEAEE
jgi:hypothetical protein